MSQQTMFSSGSFQSDSSSSVRAKVFGIGGAGVSLVDGLCLDGFDAVRTIAVDVDADVLSDCIAAEKIPIGRRLTRGMGTGGEISIGRKAVSYPPLTLPPTLIVRIPVCPTTLTNKS